MCVCVSNIIIDICMCLHYMIIYICVCLYIYIYIYIYKYYNSVGWLVGCIYFHFVGLWQTKCNII